MKKYLSSLFYLFASCSITLPLKAAQPSPAAADTRSYASAVYEEKRPYSEVYRMIVDNWSRNFKEETQVSVLGDLPTLIWCIGCLVIEEEKDKKTSLDLNYLKPDKDFYDIQYYLVGFSKGKLIYKDIDHNTFTEISLNTYEKTTKAIKIEKTDYPYNYTHDPRKQLLNPVAIQAQSFFLLVEQKGQINLCFEKEKNAYDLIGIKNVDGQLHISDIQHGMQECLVSLKNPKKPVLIIACGSGYIFSMPIDIENKKFMEGECKPIYKIDDLYMASNSMAFHDQGNSLFIVGQERGSDCNAIFRINLANEKPSKSTYYPLPKDCMAIRTKIVNEQLFVMALSESYSGTKVLNFDLRAEPDKGKNCWPCSLSSSFSDFEIAVSPDGEFFATAFELEQEKEIEIKVWDTREKEYPVVKKLKVKTDNIQNGYKLLSTSLNGLWFLALSYCSGGRKPKIITHFLSQYKP